MSHPISLSQKSKSHSIGAVTATSDCTGLQAGNAARLQYRQPQPSNTLPQYRYVRGILRLNALSIHSTKRDKARESHTTERASGGSSHVTSANAELSLLCSSVHKGGIGFHYKSLQRQTLRLWLHALCFQESPHFPSSLNQTASKQQPQSCTIHNHTSNKGYRTQAPDTSTGQKHRTQAPDTSTGQKHRTEAPDTTRVFTVHLYLLPHACTTRVKDDSVGSSHTCGEVI